MHVASLCGADLRVLEMLPSDSNWAGQAPLTEFHRILGTGYELGQTSIALLALTLRCCSDDGNPATRPPLLATVAVEAIRFRNSSLDLDRDMQVGGWMGGGMGGLVNMEHQGKSDWEAVRFRNSSLDLGRDLQVGIL